MNACDATGARSPRAVGERWQRAGELTRLRAHGLWCCSDLRSRPRSGRARRVFRRSRYDEVDEISYAERSTGGEHVHAPETRRRRGAFSRREGRPHRYEPSPSSAGVAAAGSLPTRLGNLHRAATRSEIRGSRRSPNRRRLPKTPDARVDSASGGPSGSPFQCLQYAEASALGLRGRET